MRRSTTLILPLQLMFPGCSSQACKRNRTKSKLNIKSFIGSRQDLKTAATAMSGMAVGKMKFELRQIQIENFYFYWIRLFWS
jgi:hypothetical protein